MKYILTIVASLGIIGFSFSQGSNPSTGQGTKAKQLQLNSITTAVPFMLITPDSRSGAMGDVGAGLSPDANSIYWNTSKLAFSQKSFEVSMSYSPWLQRLAKDMHLTYLSGYKKIGERHAVGGSLRYFSLGNITFTDQNGNKTRDFTPSEFELTGAYAFKLARTLSIGVNGKFVYSNLTGGTQAQGANTKPGIAGAADISFSYYDTELKMGKKKVEVGFGFVLSNIGSKISYSEGSVRDFLPMNLRLGTSLKIHVDEYNSFTFGFDLNKLLVPTPPLYLKGSDGNPYMVGKNNNVGVVSGLFQSFGDAPGTALKNDKGEYIVENGKIPVKKGSRFGEEMREITFGIGVEYWYNQLFAVRAGYFNESYTKGNRKYLTFGIGLQYKVFGLDISYLAAFSRLNPLGNTLRFTLHFLFNKKSAAKVDEE